MDPPRGIDPTTHRTMSGCSITEYHLAPPSFEGRKEERFYLTTPSTHFIYGYMASDIWLRTIVIVRKETRCRHICYSFRLAARVLLYAPSHRQDSTYHGLCYTSRGALAEREIAQWVHPMKDRSDDPSLHERTSLPRSYISLHCCEIRHRFHYLICSVRCGRIPSHVRTWLGHCIY